MELMLLSKTAAVAEIYQIAPLLCVNVIFLFVADIKVTCCC